MSGESLPVDLKKVLKERMMSLLRTTAKTADLTENASHSGATTIQEAFSTFLDEKRKQISENEAISLPVVVPPTSLEKQERPVAVAKPQPRPQVITDDNLVDPPKTEKAPEACTVSVATDASQENGRKSSVETKQIASSTKRNKKIIDREKRSLDKKRKQSPSPKRPRSTNRHHQRHRSHSESKTSHHSHRHKEKKHKENKKRIKSRSQNGSHSDDRPSRRRKLSNEAGEATLFGDVKLDTDELKKFVHNLVQQTNVNSNTTSSSYKYTYKRHPSPSVARRSRRHYTETSSSSASHSKSVKSTSNLEEISSHFTMPLQKTTVPTISAGASQSNTTGKKSLKDFTDFCRRIAEHGDAEKSSGDDVAGNDNGEEVSQKRLLSGKDVTSIKMKIRDAKQLKAKTVVEQAIEKMQSMYPVSTGVEHAGSRISEQNPGFHILIQRRLEAVKILSQNPNDYAALLTIEECDAKISNWASKQSPQATLDPQLSVTLPPPVATVQPQPSIANPYLPRPYGPEPRSFTWSDPEYLQNAAQSKLHIGKKLLEKCGWKEGQGLGKDLSGRAEPLLPEIKHDRKGLFTDDEVQPRPSVSGVASIGGAKVVGKHPVSFLGEVCAHRRWGAPLFSMVSAAGPSHRQSFVMSATVNGVTYQPTSACPTKKEAKALAALVCLQSLNLLKSAPIVPVDDVSTA